ncbi:calcium-independent phospholipase [Aureococcus anophagefferens]|uniref:Calcium-independent phospholipase n=1 Tax=Aureococcus anophagefferens TaxID=44056 RepID=A0ABR1G4E4_AURAN
MAHLDRPPAEAPREASDQMREACFVGASSWRLLVRGYAARRAPGEVVSARPGPTGAPGPGGAGAAPPAAARLDLPDTLGFASGRGRDALRAVRAARARSRRAALAPLAVGYYDGSEPAAPPPKRADSPFRPRAFAVAARETEGGALEPTSRASAARRARALDKRGATYVRLEPPLEEAVSLAETDAAKIEAMKRGVADWVAAPEQARVLDDVARLLSEEQAGLAAALARTASASDAAARARARVATLPDSVGRVTALFEPRKPEATRWPKATAFIRSRRNAP